MFLSLQQVASNIHTHTHKVLPSRFVNLCLKKQVNIFYFLLFIFFLIKFFYSQSANIGRSVASLRAGKVLVSVADRKSSFAPSLHSACYTQVRTFSKFATKRRNQEPNKSPFNLFLFETSKQVIYTVKRTRRKKEKAVNTQTKAQPQ